MLMHARPRGNGGGSMSQVQTRRAVSHRGRLLPVQVTGPPVLDQKIFTCAHEGATDLVFRFFVPVTLSKIVVETPGRGEGERLCAARVVGSPSADCAAVVAPSQGRGAFFLWGRSRTAPKGSWDRAISTSTRANRRSSLRKRGSRTRCRVSSVCGASSAGRVRGRSLSFPASVCLAPYSAHSGAKRVVVTHFPVPLGRQLLHKHHVTTTPRTHHPSEERIPPISRQLSMSCPRVAGRGRGFPAPPSAAGGQRAPTLISCCAASCAAERTATCPRPRSAQHSPC